MPEVKIKGALYKVTITEYDEGAQRPWGEKYFDNEAEAKAYCETYNRENRGIPEWYTRASYYKVKA